MPRPVAVVAAILALAAASCSPVGSAAAGTSARAGSTPLTVYAAASLGNALARIAPAYEAAHPGASLTVATDSSAALETKIEQGAPADVFLSADTSNPQKVVDAGEASGPVVAFAANRLTVVVPSANPGHVRTPADLARPGVKVVAAGDEVPITAYANRVVANLSREPGFGADFAARYAANVVSREDSVAGVVAKVELAEADAGIVYATDATAAHDVSTVEVPPAANVLATYGAVVVAGSAHPDEAEAFLDWLTGPDGQAILHSFGFLSPA